ncbi:dTDP-4-dehydrorhamnose reductase [Candidatus Gracilibacteria bacterium]|nr:dTDP-4-dehydrorhamnose reductase [Candidatus Gracilibacteria bacterium]
MTKRILLLGSTGLLGSAIAEKFQTIDDFQLVMPKRDQLDLANFSLLADYIAEVKPELIINAAGYNAVDQAEDDEVECFKLNAELPKVLAINAYQNGAKLVQFSSDYVFDGSNVDGYLESHPRTGQLNKYGVSKALGEANVENFTDNFWLIRISWLFGGRTRPNFVRSMLNLAATNSEIPVVNDQIGKPTYAPDVAKALEQLINEEYKTGIYHLPNENSVSWHDFAQTIFALKNLNIKVKPILSSELARKATRPQHSTLLNVKFPVLRPYEDALFEYLNFLS